MKNIVKRGKNKHEKKIKEKEKERKRKRKEEVRPTTGCQKGPTNGGEM